MWVKEREREGERETDRQRQTETDRHIDRQTETEKSGTRKADKSTNDIESNLLLRGDKWESDR